MFTHTLTAAAEAKRQGDKDEARRLYRLAAQQAREEGYKSVSDRLEQCAEEVR